MKHFFPVAVIACLSSQIVPAHTVHLVHCL